MPKVCVVMPVYNAMPYLTEAVASIIGQTYKDFIFLIIDDGSTDGSYEFLQSIRDQRVVLVKQNRRGPGEAMNRALEICEAPFLARMDADDVSDPRRLERQVALLESNPKIAACSCNCYYIDEQGNVIGTSTVPISPTIIRWEIRLGLRGLIQGATCFRVESLRAISGYRPHFQRAEEVDVFLRLAEKYELGNCKEFLYRIRLRRDSYSVSNTFLNSLYAKYALYCHHLRTKGKPEIEFIEFVRSRSFQAIVKRMQARTETISLQIWRQAMIDGGWLPGLRKTSLIFLAALFSPTRVVARIVRTIERAWVK
jgi:glycosyltransferase involved in cell wall biosynthesis